MYWVYESVKGHLFSLKGFHNQADAVKYADERRDAAKLRGNVRFYQVQLGHQIVYETTPATTSPEQP